MSTDEPEFPEVPASPGKTRWEPVPLPDGRLLVTEDGGVTKRVLEEGGEHGESPQILGKAYVLMTGRALPRRDAPADAGNAAAPLEADEAGEAFEFVREWKEEVEVMVGGSGIAQGMSLGLLYMREGERAEIRCTPQYGYNDVRRPAGVAADADLVFEVQLLRVEKESNIADMTVADKAEFIARRRAVGKTLFAKGMVGSALNQYKKALMVRDQAQLLDEAGDARALREEGLWDGVVEDLLVIRSNMALCYVKRKEYALAIECSNEVLQDQPGHFKARLRLAQALRLNKDFDEAAREYAKLAEMAECRDNAAVKASVQREMAAAKQQHAKVVRTQKRTFQGVFDAEELYSDKPDPTSAAPHRGCWARFVRTLRWMLFCEKEKTS